MEKKDLVEGMRLYIYKLRVDGRYSTAKSYQDALNSFMRFCGWCAGHERHQLCRHCSG